MVAQELRLGNYLQDKLTGCLLSVCNLSEQNIITTVVDRSKFPLPDGWSLEAIPLTEEWLIKFGFYQSIDQWFIDSLNGSFSIEIHSYNFYYSAGEGIRISSSIETVHGLQNLYHALTGEELKCSI